MIHVKASIMTRKLLDYCVTAGRHSGIDVILVKLNLFQQIRWSRTIGSNTPHFFLFKLPRDVHQIDLLERQMNAYKIVEKLLRVSYQRLVWTFSN